MDCPDCGNLKPRVIDTRPYSKSRRRRYQCKPCNTRFTTYEIPAGRTVNDYQQMAKLVDVLVAVDPMRVLKIIELNLQFLDTLREIEADVGKHIK